MNKTIKCIGLVLLMILSSAFDFQKAESIPEEVESYSVVYLEGAFLQNGEYKFEGEMMMKDLVDQVGVEANANMDCLNLNMAITDEMAIYLPVINSDAISLNSASQEELMTLKGVGEKTSQKIIEYRNSQPFTCLEDLMNVKGIGEKTFIKLRDYLCL